MSGKIYFTDEYGNIKEDKNVVIAAMVKLSDMLMRSIFTIKITLFGSKHDIENFSKTEVAKTEQNNVIYSEMNPLVQQENCNVIHSVLN
jgi:hypothetical protein